MKDIGEIVTVPAYVPYSRAIFERNLKWREGPSPSECSYGSAHPLFIEIFGKFPNLKKKNKSDWKYLQEREKVILAGFLI